MKRTTLITIMLLTLANCIGKRINIYNTQGKLKHTLEVGDYMQARIPYNSSYPNIVTLEPLIPSDVFAYGQIVAIDDTSIKLLTPTFYYYSNDASEKMNKVPFPVEGELVLTLNDIKALALTADIESFSGPGIGLGIGGLLISPIVSLGYGSGAFRKQRFVNWLVVSGAVIVVGTIVHTLADPGIYKFQEFNGQPNFRKYKQGTVKIE